MLSNTVDKDWRFNPDIYRPNLVGTSASAHPHDGLNDKLDAARMSPASCGICRVSDAI